MYNGDRARKKTLVKYGFRLPSALDNRPLRFEEFNERINQVIFVSATPGAYEIEQAEGRIVDQIIRPTGLLDPEIAVRPAASQVDDLLEEIRVRTELGEAVLVTTLTKRMAEDLTDYYEKLDVKVRYLHSDIKTLERIELVNDLRKGEYNVLVGINLLREGLDIPEVSLVAVLDADKEGFLRSERSLIQTCGRAARNASGMVILYADEITGSMQRTIDETSRRRKIQQAYNRENNIEPATIRSTVKDSLQKHLQESGYQAADNAASDLLEAAEEIPVYYTIHELEAEIEKLNTEMQQAAKELAFEEAAAIRDKIKMLRKLEIEIG